MVWHIVSKRCSRLPGDSISCDVSEQAFALKDESVPQRSAWQAFDGDTSFKDEEMKGTIR